MTSNDFGSQFSLNETSNESRATVMSEHKEIEIPKGNTSKKRQFNREILSTFLTTHENDFNNCAEKLLEEEISYNDLGSLNDCDLKLMGIKNANERSQLLEFFSHLPNQDPSFDSIIKNKESLTYNRRIFRNANNHLIAMRCALAATNYKLHFMPPNDVIVDNKYYASKFVVETLQELKKATINMREDLLSLEKQLRAEENLENKNKISNTSLFTKAMFLSTIASGIILVIYFVKFKK